jgi:hypothetical protein
MRPRLLLVSVLLLVTATVSAQTISSVFPGSGRPGDLVYIEGKNLLATAAACAPVGCAARVTIGGVDAAKVSVTNSEVVVIAPDHAAGAADVTFTTAGYPASTLTGAYTFEYASSGDYERMLVPVGGTTPGAFGSVWIAPVSAYPEKSMAVRVPYCVNVTCGSELQLNAGTPAKFGVNGSSSGAFLYVPREFANDVDFVIHVLDSTHPSDSHVEVPVVRARDFRPSVRFLDIPIGVNVRSNLRVYGYSAGSVTVTVRDTTSGRITGTTQFQLQGGSTDIDFPTYPWTVGILPDLLTGVSLLHTAMIEVTSDNGGPIWAFITLTNNDTQHVDLVLPFRKD